MEISCLDPTNNGFCKLHSTYLGASNQLPVLTTNRFSVHKPNPSFVYLPYGNSIKPNQFANNFQTQENYQFNNNGNTQLPFERSNLLGRCGNILRQKNNAECSYAPIGWKNNIPQCSYDERNAIRPYRYEQSRIPALPELPWNRNGCDTSSRFTEEFNYRPTTQPQIPQISQELVRLSKVNLREGAYNPKNFQKTINNECSYGRRESFNPRKSNFNERHFEEDTITGEPLFIRRRSTEHNQNPRFLERNSYNFTSPETTAEVQEKIKYYKTNMQNEYKPTIRQESFIGDTGRPAFNRYCSTGNGFSEILSGHRKQFEEEFSKNKRRQSPYETEYCNPIENQRSDFGRVRRELQQSGRKNNEKFDCACCCHMNNKNQNNNYIYGFCNPFDMLYNDRSNRNDETSKKPFIGNNVNQFRNKFEQGLLCHKQYTADSDRGSDDEFNTALMSKCNPERPINNIYSNINDHNSNNIENKRLCSINENQSWKHNRNIVSDPRGDGDTLLTPNNSNSHINDRYSSDDETPRKLRRSILQNRRGEGGRILRPNNPMDPITNSGYLSNICSSDDEIPFRCNRSSFQNGRGEVNGLNTANRIINRSHKTNIFSSDDEPSFESHRSFLQNSGREGGNLLRSENSIDRIMYKTRPVNTMLSDDENSLKPRRSILQYARGEGGRLLKPNSIDHINNRRPSYNLLSSDDETTVVPRRSILQGPRGEGGRILTPNNSNNLVCIRSNRSNRTSSEDEDFLKPLTRFKSNSMAISRFNRRSNNLSANYENICRPQYRHSQNSNCGSDIYSLANNCSTNRNHNTNMSSSEDEGYLKPLARIMENKTGTLYERNHPNENNHRFIELSSDNETCLASRRSVGTDPIGGHCISKNSCAENKTSNPSKITLTVDCRIPVDNTSLKPRRSILQSRRGESGGFLKRTNSNKSFNSRTSSQYTVCLNSDEETNKKKINDIKPPTKYKNPPTFSKFSNKYELPCCQAILQPAVKTFKKLDSPLNRRPNRSLASHSAPSQSIASHLIPLRRTNSASHNHLPTTVSPNSRITKYGRQHIAANVWPNARPLYNGRQIQSTNNTIDQNEAKTIKRPSIFRYLNQLEKLTEFSTPNPKVIGKKSLNVGTGTNTVKANSDGVPKKSIRKVNTTPKKLNPVNKVNKILVPFK